MRIKKATIKQMTVTAAACFVLLFSALPGIAAETVKENTQTDSTVLKSLPLLNSGFENAAPKGSAEPVDGWVYDFYYKDDQHSTIAIDTTQAHSGTASLKIDSKQANDARIYQDVPVEQNCMYRLSAWVRTENVGSAQIGANLSVRDIPFTPSDLKGTNKEWQQIHTYVISGNGVSSLKLTVGIGGYGSVNTGTAWFDDITVDKIVSMPADQPLLNMNPPVADTAQSGNVDSNAAAEPTSGNSNSIYIITIVVMGALVYLVYRMSVKKSPATAATPEQEKVDIEELVVPQKPKQNATKSEESNVFYQEEN